MAGGALNRVKSATMGLDPRHRTSAERPLHRATVASAFVNGMLSGLPRRGAAAARLLHEAGLGPEIRTGAQRAPIAAYAALYNGVVRELGDEGFGLFSQPLRAGTFEFLCRSVIGARTLGEALERAARFLDVVLPDLAVSIASDGALARIVVIERRRLRPRAADPARVFAFEWLLRLLHGLACWLAARALTLDHVRFPYPRPAHAADYALVYTEHSTFGARALEASLAAALLELPVRRGESDLTAFLEGSPGKISMLYRRDRDVARAVREALSATLADAPDFAAVARRLQMSPRTLHRRLADEGTSYRAVRETLRREHALQRIEKTEQSVADIAAALGYSEPSAFFRAFVGWTGLAPSVYRKRNKTPRPTA